MLQLGFSSTTAISAFLSIASDKTTVTTRLKLASISTPIEGDAPGAGAGSPAQGRKRNASLAGFDSSPASIESPDQNGDESHARDFKRRPVKRACNECRQQKVCETTE